MRQNAPSASRHLLGFLLASFPLVGCTAAADQAARSSLADTNGLVTLPQLKPMAPDTAHAPQLAMTANGDSVRLTVLVEPGDQINALQPPVLTTEDGRRILFDAPAVTPDSSYFVGEVAATVARDQLPIRGVLSTSYCRAGEKLCRSARRAVSVP